MTVDVFTALLDELGNVEPDAALVGDACARHLTVVRSSDLPPDAQLLWREVAKLLKGSPEQFMPAKSFGTIKSWPAARVAQLLAQFREIQTIIDRCENERLEDEIRDKIRRHYL